MKQTKENDPKVAESQATTLKICSFRSKLSTFRVKNAQMWNSFAFVQAKTLKINSMKQTKKKHAFARRHATQTYKTCAFIYDPRGYCPGATVFKMQKSTRRCGHLRVECVVVLRSSGWGNGASVVWPRKSSYDFSVYGNRRGATVATM